MEAEKFLDRLTHFQTVLPAMVGDIPDPDMRWKPPSGNWSLLEIVCHLAHEESHDFRTRLKSTLDDPSQPWPRIDPLKTVQDESFNERDVNESIEWFLSERKLSLQWLRAVLDSGTPDWNSAHHHPQFGPIKAGDLFASWVAHDQLHIRQLAKRIYELTERDACGYRLNYAGDLN